MSNELNISLGQPGLTVTASLYGGGVVVSSGIPCAEIIGQGGYYSGSMPVVAAGYYDVQFFANGLLRGSGNIGWSGTAEISIETAMQATNYTAPPSVGAIQAGLATSANVMSAQSVILSAIGSPLQSNSYVAPPSAATIATTTATALFVDGTTNLLKVNSDHSITTSNLGATIANYITIPASVAEASQDPTLITCIRGDTLRVSLPPMGDLTSRTKLMMTAKASITDSDSQAVLQVIEGIGLTRLNGTSPVTPTTAGLAIINAMTGTVALEVDASITAALAVCDLIWDVQAYLATGISTPISGTLSIIADVTQSVT